VKPNSLNQRTPIAGLVANTQRFVPRLPWSTMFDIVIAANRLLKIGSRILAKGRRASFMVGWSFF